MKTFFFSFFSSLRPIQFALFRSFYEYLWIVGNFFTSGAAGIMNLRESKRFISSCKNIRVLARIVPAREESVWGWSKVENALFLWIAVQSERVIKKKIYYSNFIRFCQSRNAVLNVIKQLFASWEIPIKKCRVVFEKFARANIKNTKFQICTPSLFEL